MKKKIWTLLTTALLALPLFAGATSVHADDDATPTVNFTLHKVVGANAKQNTGDEDTTFGGTALPNVGFKVFDVTSEFYTELAKQSDSESATVQKVVETLQKTDVSKKTPVKGEAKTATDGSVTFSSLPVTQDKGTKYKVYLFQESSQPSGVDTSKYEAATPMVVVLGSDIASKGTIHLYPKNELQETKITKKVVSPATMGTHEIGDVIPYQVEFVVPAKANKQLIVTDTPTTGLKLTGDVTVKVDGTDYAVTNYILTKNTDSGYSLKFNNPGTLVGRKITLNYSMVIANVGNQALENKVQLTVNDNGTIDPDADNIPKVWTGQQAFKKIDSSSNSGLENAEFKVTNKAGDKYLQYTKSANGDTTITWGDASTATIFKSTTDGTFSVDGLKTGDYVLVETKAPTGYALPAGDAAKTAFTISDTTAGPVINASQNVTNVKKGFLPSTGGSGIYAFLLIGAALMMGTAIWYKKSKNSAEV